MKQTKDHTLQAVFVIPPKVHLLDITGPAQIFYEAACNGAPIKLLFSTIFREQTESDSLCSLSFNQLIPYDQLTLTEGDLVFLPGISFSLLTDDSFLHTSRPFLQWVTVQHQNGVTICSVCIGSFLLAASGLLDHRACTTHWEFTDRLKTQYPKARVQTNRLFVQEDRIYTSAGITSGIDLSLYLLEQLWGPYFAAKIAKEAVVYFRRTLDDPQLNVFTQYRNHLDHRIHTVQDILIQWPDQKFKLEDLAAKVNMSARNLTRHFKKTTGITIGTYHDQLRAEYAEKLVSEGHTLQATALHCGLKSINQLRHLLRRHLPAKDKTAVA
jgi:transcriptional regulator GlxA family with amidase domain